MIKCLFDSFHVTPVFFCELINTSENEAAVMPVKWSRPNSQQKKLTHSESEMEHRLYARYVFHIKKMSKVTKVHTQQEKQTV